MKERIRGSVWPYRWWMPEDPDTYFAAELLESKLLEVPPPGLCRLTHALEHLAKTGSLRLIPVRGGLQ